MRWGLVARAGAAVLAAAFGVALTPPSTAGPPLPVVPPVLLRVATYNIHAGAGEDNVFNLERTAQAIRSLDADVVGLQEVDVHWSARSDFADEARDLARRLAMRVYFAPIYDLAPAEPGAPRRQFGVAVLSRHPIIHAENHEITRLSTQERAATPALAPGFPEVTVDVRGRPVHVYATHLDYRPDPAVRTAQIKDMLGVMNADRSPRILVGDFNAEPEAPELAPLWETMRDGARDAGDTHPAAAPDRRIDLLTASPDVAISGARTVATTASDHRPVVADLAVP